MTMSDTQHAAPAPSVAEPIQAGIPTFHVPSFNVTATSNEVFVIGSEVYPTWGSDGAAHPPVTAPRVLIRLSPQSLKDLADMLHSFVAKYEASYGELHTDYLLRKAAKPA